MLNKDAMKNLIIILVSLTLFSCVEFEPLQKNDKVYILFEQGTSVPEEVIIKAQELKGKLRGMDYENYYSHCSIMIDSVVYTTHPAHGVMKFTMSDVHKNDSREYIEWYVQDKEALIDELEYLIETEDKYNKIGALMTVAPIPSPNKPTKFFCSKLVAYALFFDGDKRFKRYGNMDMLDVYMLVR